jgi:hypothetical protein
VISAATFEADVRRGGHGGGIADRFTSWLTWLKVLRGKSMEAMPKISYREKLASKARC